MILELMQLTKELKIHLPVHDLINWIENRLDLVCHPHRINGQVVLYVHTGCPFAEIMNKENKFYEQAKAIYNQWSNKDAQWRQNRLRTQDIKDRFMSHGKLWLVLAKAVVVEESTVRIYAESCRNCKAVAKDPREAILLKRQELCCLGCFSSRLPEDMQTGYILSTNRCYRRSNGFAISYDPILGICQRDISPNDYTNRETVRRLMYAESNDGNQD